MNQKGAYLRNLLYLCGVFSERSIMVKHIVLFQLRADIDSQQKLSVMQSFRNAIMALPTDIPFIRKIEVAFNINPDEKYDVALYSEFDTLEHVNAYAVHPSHLKAAGIIKPCVQSRACTDYES